MKQNISIVTGGSSGLGKELVQELINKGHNVCIIARDEKKIIDSIDSFTKNNTTIEYFAGDLCDELFIKEVFKQIIAKGFYVDYLFNCAGVGVFGDPKDMCLEKITKGFNSNVYGLMVITYEACRNMIDGGTIVNIMSTAALKGNAMESVYCAAKWAVRGFTEALQAYYKKTNTHVIGVYPGGMNTSFWTANCGLSPDVNKFMNPNEVAKVIIDSVLDRDTSYTASLTIERK